MESASAFGLDWGIEEMISRKVLALIIVSMTPPLTYADNWQPLTGADTLQQFVSGATAEIELRPGVTAVGKYNADGTAEIEAWNETFSAYLGSQR